MNVEPSLREAPSVLTPRKIRSAEFTRTSLGRRGYNEDEVRLFLSRVAENLAASDAEKANLRAEVNRLKDALKRWQSERAGRPGTTQARPGQPSIEAVNLLSQAQQAADVQVAQAEDYSRRLVALAREQYEKILGEAQQQATAAAEDAVRAYRERSPDATNEEREALERRLVWLQTFAEVTQVQLRSVLDALTREVDKLGDVPGLAGVPPAPGAAGLPGGAEPAGGLRGMAVSVPTHRS